jgi:hypothetical protein
MVFQAFDLSYIYEIGTIIGIGFLVFCLYFTEKIIRLFPGAKMVLKWRIMQILIISFIVLYIVDWIVWIFDIQFILFIIGGIIRLGGAVLIALIIILFYRTINIVFLGSRKKEE